MYSKTETAKILNISRTTLYNRLNVLGYDKSTEINEEILTQLQSLTNTKQSHEQRTDEQNEQTSTEQLLIEQLKVENNELKSVLNKREQDIIELKRRIEFLDNDNRNLMQNYQNQQLMYNETNKQFSETLMQMKQLTFSGMEETVKEEKQQEPKPEQKKSWWKR